MLWDVVFSLVSPSSDDNCLHLLICENYMCPMARLRVCVQQVQVEFLCQSTFVRSTVGFWNMPPLERICGQGQLGAAPKSTRRLRRRREEWQPKPGGTACPSKPKEQTESSVEPLGSFWSQLKGTPGLASTCRAPSLVWLCAILLPGLHVNQDRSVWIFCFPRTHLFTFY